MIRVVSGENQFQILNNGGFTVSPSNEGYTLCYSADGEHYTQWDEATPANEVLIVTGLPMSGMFFKLLGNQSEVKVKL